MIQDLIQSIRCYFGHHNYKVAIRIMNKGWHDRILKCEHCGDEI